MIIMTKFEITRLKRKATPLTLIRCRAFQYHMMKKYLIVLISFFPILVNGQNRVTVKVGDEYAYESIYVALNGGCSLGCALGWDITTSSTLSSQGNNNYGAENLEDGKKETAWVEGKQGYGIGEKIEIKGVNMRVIGVFPELGTRFFQNLDEQCMV